MEAKVCLICAIVVLLFALGIGGNRNDGEKVRVRVKEGEIEGIQTKTVGGAEYLSFLGIPYAKPPLGNLRFAAPQPIEKWKSTLDATKPANTCIEMYFENRGREDCLYLNVFTPANRTSLKEKSLPAIVWIHGGAFVFIYGNHSLNGADFFIEENVIFVTVHYRLGPFGFLSTEDDVIPGNFGLEDQALAIEWIHENIEAFGGNRKKITLMGQSAGAVSVAYMGMVPKLKGKFSAIIQQSGSSLCPFGLGRYHRTAAYALSTRLGLQTQNSTAILENLRNADAEDIRKNALIVHIDIAFGMGTFHGLVFIPRLESKSSEKAVLTEFSHEQLKNGHFHRIPRMIGINSLEGIFIIDEFKSLKEYYKNYDENPRRFIPVSMNTRNENAGKLIKEHYTKGAPFTNDISNMVHFGSDDQFVRPILKDARLVSKKANKTFLYHFSYLGELGLKNRPLQGVNHGEEIEYLFYDKNHGQISENDEKIRKKLVRLWSNFAKFGNPTPSQEEILDDKIWRPIDGESDETNYFDIGSKLRSSVNPHREDVEFWEGLYKNYGNPPYDTY